MLTLCASCLAGYIKCVNLLEMHLILAGVLRIFLYCINYKQLKFYHFVLAWMTSSIPSKALPVYRYVNNIKIKLLAVKLFHSNLYIDLFAIQKKKLSGQNGYLALHDLYRCQFARRLNSKLILSLDFYPMYCCYYYD